MTADQPPPAAAVPGSLFERHPKATVGVLLCLTLVPLDYLAGRRLAWAHRLVEKSYRMPSPFYHHDLRPNRSVSVRWGDNQYTMTTDSMGFRDQAVRDVAPHGSRPRLLFIGDSFTEGSGVAYEDSFVGRVARALPGTEVLNAGVASYSPIIYYRKAKHLLEERGLRFDEVAVFLDISDVEDETEYDFDADGNVVENAQFDSDRSRGLGDDFLTQHSALFQVGQRLLMRLRLRWYWNRPQDLMTLWPYSSDRARWTFDDRAFHRFGEQGLDRARSHMEMLVGLLREHGIPLYLAVYPWPPQIVFDTLESRQVRYWREWAEHEGVPFLDYFPEFLEGDKLQTIHDCFIPGDMHWSPTGHARVARGFVSFLERSRLKSQ